MNDILNQSHKIRNLLNELPEVKEYFKLKNLFENDPELIEIRNSINSLEKENKLEEKKALLEIYNNNPIVNNFNIAKEEVLMILKQIKDILSD